MPSSDKLRLLDLATKGQVEHDIKAALSESGLHFLHRQPLGVEKIQPDFIADRDHILFLIDIDLNQNKSYNKSAQAEDTLEIQRWADKFHNYAAEKKLGQIKVAYVRFNPDSYTRQGVEVQSMSFSQKVTGLIHLLKNYQPQQAFELIFLYFDADEFGELQVPWLNEPSCSQLKWVAKSLQVEPNPQVKESSPQLPIPIADGPLLTHRVPKRTRESSVDTPVNKRNRKRGYVTFVTNKKTGYIRSLVLHYKQRDPDGGAAKHVSVAYKVNDILEMSNPRTELLKKAESLGMPVEAFSVKVEPILTRIKREQESL